MSYKITTSIAGATFAFHEGQEVEAIDLGEYLKEFTSKGIAVEVADVETKAIESAALETEAVEVAADTSKAKPAHKSPVIKGK